MTDKSKQYQEAVTSGAHLLEQLRAANARAEATEARVQLYAATARAEAAEARVQLYAAQVIVLIQAIEASLSAVRSHQVYDKDVRGTLERALYAVREFSGKEQGNE